MACFSGFCRVSTAVDFDDAFEAVFGDIFSPTHCASGVGFVLGLCEGVVGARLIPLSCCGVAFAIVLRGGGCFAVEARGVVGILVFMEEAGCFVSVLGGGAGAFLEGTLWRCVRGVVSFRDSDFWLLVTTVAVVLVAVVAAEGTRIFFTASGGAAVSGV